MVSFMKMYKYKYINIYLEIHFPSPIFLFALKTMMHNKKITGKR